jgi:hypothetical protein
MHLPLSRVAERTKEGEPTRDMTRAGPIVNNGADIPEEIDDFLGTWRRRLEECIESIDKVRDNQLEKTGQACR